MVLRRIAYTLLSLWRSAERAGLRRHRLPPAPERARLSGEFSLVATAHNLRKLYRRRSEPLTPS